VAIYLFKCDECSWEVERFLKVEDRALGEGPCFKCEGGNLKRCIGNNGGFRLLEGGAVSWGDGGYNTIHGDIENFKAGRKVY